MGEKHTEILQVPPFLADKKSAQNQAILCKKMIICGTKSPAAFMPCHDGKNRECLSLLLLVVYLSYHF